MSIFISLGVELGIQEDLNGFAYRVLVNDNVLLLSSLQYSVYYLGQMAQYTKATAAEELKENVNLVGKAVDQLVSMGILIYYDDINEEFFKTHTITPRGNFESNCSVKSTSFARPSVLTQFSHELWVFSNPTLTIDKIFLNLNYYLGYSYGTCCQETTSAIPILLREGLIILNPLKTTEDSSVNDFVST